MIVRVEEARPVHVYEILHNLRAREAAIVAGIEDPAERILDEMRASTRSYVGLFDGEAVCLWGVQIRTILADAVYLWMFTTRAVEEHPFVFVRHSQRMAEAILEEYGTIEGIVAIDNPTSAKWLHWLGAEFGPSSIEGMVDFRLRRSQYAERLASHTGR
jgi:hypothetical protein